MTRKKILVPRNRNMQTHNNQIISLTSFLEVKKNPDPTKATIQVIMKNIT
jgi:hypothetical protein